MLVIVLLTTLFNTYLLYFRNTQSYVCLFSIAFFTDNLITPAGLRYPEIILEETPRYSQDIWSLGCLTFEFISGSPLFAINTTGDED